MISIFELLDEVKKACGDHKDLATNLELQLKPDFFFHKDQRENMKENTLAFTLLKIIMKVAKKGVDMKALFESWDADGSGCLDAQEILDGIQRKLKLPLTSEEAHHLTEHLDKDGDGQITYQEFHEKVNFKDYKVKQDKYMISLKNFTDKVLNEWYNIRN